MLTDKISKRKKQKKQKKKKRIGFETFEKETDVK